MRSTTSLALLLAAAAAARDVPTNLKSFYDSHKVSCYFHFPSQSQLTSLPQTGKCPNALSIAYDSGEGKGDSVYCKDDTSGVVYLKDTSNGYADADVDCDGLNASKGDCNNDPSGQSMTAFQDQVQKFGIDDLDAHIHTYVVLGNDNSASEGDGGKKFDPQSVGIKPLSLVAVVCNNKLIYAVWGDVNGGKVTGEASLSVVQLCFPNESINGDAGHGDHDVLYLAFSGDDAVPGSSANWKAGTREEFEASLATTGDKLIAEHFGSATAAKVLSGTNSTTPSDGSSGNKTHHHHHQEETTRGVPFSRIMRGILKL